MNSSALAGAVLAIIGGTLQGIFGVPMKYARRWNHENIWLVFVLSGLLVLPWILTLITIPHLAAVYRVTPLHSLALIVVCGIGWGIGAALVGIAFRMLGIGLSFAIVLGLAALGGSLVPFLTHSGQISSGAGGRLLLLGAAVMLMGIALVSFAGSMRERAIVSEESSDGKHRARFGAGLLVAIAAGIFSSLLSDAIAFSSGMVDTARALGASSVWASNVVLAPVVTGGSVANLVYCGFMMRRNHSAGLLWKPEVASYWIYGITMGICWYGGLAVYGLGEQAIGSVIGWPLFIGAMILSSSAAGFLTGEWNAAGLAAKSALCAGNVVIFSSLIIVGIASRS